MSSDWQNRLLGESQKGSIFILSAPAGTGKTTLVDMLVEEFPRVKKSVTCTTRNPRKGEIPGLHYHFLSKEEFLQGVEDDDFLEHVELFGYHYGTPKKWVEEQLEEGYHIILVIDTQGALLLKEKLDATYIFVSPPDMEILKKRLERRGSEEPAELEQRLQKAEQEMEVIKHYDYQIVNEDLDRAYQALRALLIAEGHRIKKEERD